MDKERNVVGYKCSFCFEVHPTPRAISNHLRKHVAFGESLDTVRTGEEVSFIVWSFLPAFQKGPYILSLRGPCYPVWNVVWYCVLHAIVVYYKTDNISFYLRFGAFVLFINTGLFCQQKAVLLGLCICAIVKGPISPFGYKLPNLPSNKGPCVWLMFAGN